MPSSCHDGIQCGHLRHVGQFHGDLAAASGAGIGEPVPRPQGLDQCGLGEVLGVPAITREQVRGPGKRLVARRDERGELGVAHHPSAARVRCPQIQSTWK
jgi:hypothetical protein